MEAIIFRPFLEGRGFVHVIIQQAEGMHRQCCLLWGILCHPDQFYPTARVDRKEEGGKNPNQSASIPILIFF